MDDQTRAFEERMLRNQQKLIDDMYSQLDDPEFKNVRDPKYLSAVRTYNGAIGKFYMIKNNLEFEDKPKKSQTKPLPPIPDAWRNDIVTFADQALDTELYPHQRQFCRSSKRINIMIAGRGAGKSVAARVKALHNALMLVNHTVLVVSSGQRMSTDFGSQLLDLIRESSIIDYVKSISTEQVRFKNGSKINLLPANPETIRGYHPRPSDKRKSMTVILDEACFMENGDEIRKAVEYALITTQKVDGQLYIVTSPSSTRSWVYQYVKLAEKPDADIFLIQTGSSANPSISPAEIERLRRTKNELEFRAEVLGEWVDGAYGLFGGLIDQNIIDPQTTPLPQDIECSLGADLALSFSPNHDRNALAVIAKWWDRSGPEPEQHYRLMALEILEQASDLELKEIAKKLIIRYKVRNAVVEQYQGKSLTEYLQSLKLPTKLVAPTSAIQQTIFHELHSMLRQKRFQLPKNLPPIFFEEMKAFEYRRDANGNISFGHPLSGKIYDASGNIALTCSNPGQIHDDTVYATAWALHAAQEDLPPRRIYPLPTIAFIPKQE